MSISNNLKLEQKINGLRFKFIQAEYSTFNSLGELIKKVSLGDYLIEQFILKLTNNKNILKQKKVRDEIKTLYFRFYIDRKRQRLLFIPLNLDEEYNTDLDKLIIKCYDTPLGNLDFYTIKAYNKYNLPIPMDDINFYRSIKSIKKGISNINLALDCIIHERVPCLEDLSISVFKAAEIPIELEEE